MSRKPCGTRSPMLTGAFPNRRTHEYFCKEMHNHSPLKGKNKDYRQSPVSSGQFLLPNEFRAGQAESCCQTNYQKTFQFWKIRDFGIRDKKPSTIIQWASPSIPWWIPALTPKTSCILRTPCCARPSSLLNKWLKPWGKFKRAAKPLLPAPLLTHSAQVPKHSRCHWGLLQPLNSKHFISMLLRTVIKEPHPAFFQTSRKLSLGDRLGN